jgi:hypothetical protein
MYTTIRNIHLILASFSLPFLVMYGVSAVQMSHNDWFTMKPSVREQQIPLTHGMTDARQAARQLMDRDPSVRGELANVQVKGTQIAFRIVVPGTVHDVQYDQVTGDARLKTSVADAMGMLNRLHHAAGLWHEPAALQAWGFMVALVSSALLLVGATGVYMWFTRRPERRLGLVLLGVNVLFAVTVLMMMRASGP